MTRPCTLVLLTLSAPLSAGSDDPRNVVDFGALTGGTGPVTRVVAGDFTEDWEPDVVLLDGGAAKLAYATYLFDAATLVEPSLTNVADIAALRGASGQKQDVLLATDSRGLLALLFDVANGVFLPPVVVAGGAWADAAPILTAVDAGTDLVFGIDGGDTLLSLVRVGGTLVPGPTFTTTDDVLELAALDWDGDGTIELVFRTDAGLEVREIDGTLIRYIAGPDLGALAVVTDGNGVDWLAWGKRTLPASYYELELLNEATWNAPLVDVDLRVPEDPGTAGTPTIDLDLRSIATGDLNGGGPDLLLTHATNQSVYVLLDTKGGPAIDYDPSGAVHRFGRSTNPLSPAVGTVAHSAVRQLDNDKRVDLALVTNEDRELRVYTGLSFSGGSTSSYGPRQVFSSSSNLTSGGGGRRAGRGSTMNLVSESRIVGGSHDVLGPQPTDFYVDFNLPNIQSSTHLQITLWQQDEGMGNPVHADENTIFPLGECTGSTFHSALVSIAQSLGANPRPYYFFQYRLLEMAGPEVLGVQMSRIGVCAPEVTPGEFSRGPLAVPFLEENLLAENPLPVSLGEFTCTTGPDGGAILGVIYGDSLPPLPPPSTVPNPGPWNVTLLNTINH